MPDEPTKAAEKPQGELVNQGQSNQNGHFSEAMQAGMMQIFGDQEAYKPTKSQVDKMLALQEKGMDYTHAERTMFQPKQVLEVVVFVAILLFIAGVLTLVIFKAPQYTGEAISSVIGLLGGGGIGYGVGLKKRNSEDE